MRKPSLISAGLGVAALVLAGLIVGRVSAEGDDVPADFTPVVITATPSAPPTNKPTPPATTGPPTQIAPIPHDIGDDHGGRSGKGGKGRDHGEDD